MTYFMGLQRALPRRGPEGPLKAKLFRLVGGHPIALNRLVDRLDEPLESDAVHDGLRDRRLSIRRGDRSLDIMGE